LESSYFCYLGAHAKIWNPTTIPSEVLATAVTRKQEEQEKKKKNMQNSGLRLSDTVCTAPLGPICKIVAYGCQTPSAQRRSDQNNAEFTV
jgi:hypothetical protein